jgi:pimeloyl-ACP methyl ester carboxylesterase
MYLIINGHRINYKVINSHLFDLEKPVLIFLHEGLGSIGQWKSFPQKVCDTLQLKGIVYERYGYGLSDSLREKRNENFLHDEGLIYLPGLIENLKITNKVILIGHSDGATIALIYASKFSDKLLCLISEAAHVLLEDISRNGIIKIKGEYESNKLFKEKLMKYHTEKVDTMFYGWIDAWLMPEMENWNIESLLSGIKVPVLAIQGDNDEHGTFKQLDSIKKNIQGNVEIFNIPDCGHVPHLEASEKVLSKICTFISNNILILQLK